jgi:hypothetical protein
MANGVFIASPVKLRIRVVVDDSVKIGRKIFFKPRLYRLRVRLGVFPVEPDRPHAGMWFPPVEQVKPEYTDFAI